MQPDAMITTLRSLKLFGMAHAVAELGEQGGPAFHAAQGMLSDLLKAEIAEREVRSVAYQMKIARLVRCQHCLARANYRCFRGLQSRVSGTVGRPQRVAPTNE